MPKGDPYPNVGGKHPLDDFGILESGKATLSVALKQQTGLQRRLHHGLSHGGKSCRHSHHIPHGDRRKNQQLDNRWNTLNCHCRLED